MCGTNSDAMLAWAVERGLLAVASRALELGADPDALDGIGRRPWQVAESQFAGLTTPKGALGACVYTLG